MLFNYRVRLGFIRTNGTKRLHYFKLKREGETGYELGINIIPRRLGGLIYMWITNNDVILRKRLQQKNETIDDLIDTIKMVMGR